MDLRNPHLLLLLTFVFATPLAYPLDESTNPLVKIGDGEIIGTFESSVSGKQHSAFLGIPFAQPPVRF